MKSGIYCIRHKTTGKCYVGLSIDVEERINDHKRGEPTTPAIYNAIKKHGIRAFYFEVVEICELDNLHQRERFWIVSLNTKKPNGYNLTDGGDGTFGWIPSQETRDKISKSNKVSQAKEETIRKKSESAKLQWQCIKSNPEKYADYRRKLSKSQKVAQNRPETRDKNRQSHLKRRYRSSPNQLKLF